MQDIIDIQIRYVLVIGKVCLFIVHGWLPPSVFSSDNQLFYQYLQNEQLRILLSSPFITLTNLRCIQHCIYSSVFIRYGQLSVSLSLYYQETRTRWFPRDYIGKYCFYISVISRSIRFLTGRKAMTKLYISIFYCNTHLLVVCFPLNRKLRLKCNNI